MIAETLIAITLVSPQPKPKHFDKAMWSLIAADASVRALDTYSTHRMLQGPNHEMFLPNAISHHVPAMAACSGAVVLTNALAARYLVRHHHPRMAKFVLAVDVASTGYFSINNLTLKGPKR